MRPCISIHALTRISRTHGHAEAHACACAAAATSPSGTMPHGQQAQPIAAPAPRWIMLTNDDHPPPDPTVCARLRGRGCVGKGRARAPACVRGAGSLYCFDDVRIDAMIRCLPRRDLSTYRVFFVFVCLFVCLDGRSQSSLAPQRSEWRAPAIGFKRIRT